MVESVPSHELLRLSAQIVSAHVARHAGPAAGLPDLIRSVYAALSRAGGPEETSTAPREPAVPIKKSVFPSHIVCLEDGKKLKMLKRHLQTSYGMTPEEYRAKWHLPTSYPMVAPEYAARRSTLAKQAGLGRKAIEPEPEVKAEVVAQKIPAGVRGRKPKPPQPADTSA